jgi:hypothetical protein
MLSRLFAVQSDKVAAIQPFRYGAVLRSDLVAAGGGLAQRGEIGFAAPERRLGAACRGAVHADRGDRRMGVTATGGVAALGPGAGALLVPVARPAAAGSGIPSQIGGIAVLARQAQIAALIQEIVLGAGPGRQGGYALRRRTATRDARANSPVASDLPAFIQGRDRVGGISRDRPCLGPARGPSARGPLARGPLTRGKQSGPR